MNTTQWLVGIVADIAAKGGMHAAYTEWAHQYGPIFKVS